MYISYNNKSQRIYIPSSQFQLSKAKFKLSKAREITMNQPVILNHEKPLMKPLMWKCFSVVSLSIIIIISKYPHYHNSIIST